MTSPAPPSVSPGQIFGKYVIKRVMAEGGMATVYEANHRKLGHRVAVKLLARHLMAKPDVVERFEREARAAAQLDSAHVVRVIDVDVADDGRPYIVMEYLEGRDLETELRARQPMPIGDVVGYVLEACAAVATAHRAGVIHRDIKPANIFLANDGSRRTVKILDFGISKVSTIDAVSTTSTQTMLGTPLYMSPEQVRSARDVDGRTDIWSLGVVLYESLTGQLPFMSEDASGVIAAIVSEPVVPVLQLRPEVPQALADIVMKALEKDRNQRFRLVDELAMALMPFAPAWFRPPRMSTAPPFLPSHPAHLMASLSEGIDSDRTVADPNAAPDALRTSAPLQPIVEPPRPAEISQPSAVTRTTAGGDKRTPSAKRGFVIAIVLGVTVAVVVFAAIVRVRMQATQAPATGTLDVRASPGACDVTIDGDRKGTTPLVSVEVLAGTHTITCTTPTGPKTQTIQIAAGESKKVLF